MIRDTTLTNWQAPGGWVAVLAAFRFNNPMCGRYTFEMHQQRIMGLYGLEEILDDLPPRYNIAPSQKVPVVGVKPDGKTRGLAMLSWGLVPKWVHELKGAMRPINARSETILSKPSFRDAFLHRRCVIPASGFFEWKAEGKKKKAHYVTLKGDHPMSFAGIWETWGRGPERLSTCCILTVAANDLLKPLHERMPAILPDGSLDAWLARDTPPETARSLLKAYNDAQMAVTPVGPAVNSVANDGPECIAPLAG